ncbi:uncharacterized protein GGS25DRAFT_524272 [Hypoxylon fragiforme]|uniref:uncharacterized protein n=1 Tax=Hypoxylon fragiforme TaxID=63214 RepID=UPI0020C6FB06|nr:uncharacterized protein GGS25DRAFT_524272 [Hypoxylon fragiforme]KAI2604780.1 hypothetical protein GGS25DRAFT_524272 [Hypoxylon fragiforme]
MHIHNIATIAVLAMGYLSHEATAKIAIGWREKDEAKVIWVGTTPLPKNDCQTNYATQHHVFSSSSSQSICNSPTSPGLKSAPFKLKRGDGALSSFEMHCARRVDRDTGVEGAPLLALCRLDDYQCVQCEMEAADPFDGHCGLHLEMSCWE